MNTPHLAATVHVEALGIRSGQTILRIPKTPRWAVLCNRCNGEEHKHCNDSSLHAFP